MPESTMQTQTTCCPSSEDLAMKDREFFSHQTLVLTALSAITAVNQHPKFKDDEVRIERLAYMQTESKSTHTRVIDAATTILVTNAEVLATMAREGRSIVTLNATIRKGQDPFLGDLLQSSGLNNKTRKIFGKVDELLPGDLDVMNSDPKSGGQVFVSFPNPRRESLMPSSDRVCEPTALVSGYWTEIWKSKKVLIGCNP
jgi:hypothetical protein